MKALFYFIYTLFCGFGYLNLFHDTNQSAGKPLHIKLCIQQAICLGFTPTWCSTCFIYMDLREKSLYLFSVTLLISPPVNLTWFFFVWRSLMGNMKTSPSVTSTSCMLHKLYVFFHPYYFCTCLLPVNFLLRVVFLNQGKLDFLFTECYHSRLLFFPFALNYCIYRLPCCWELSSEIILGIFSRHAWCTLPLRSVLKIFRELNSDWTAMCY